MLCISPVLLNLAVSSRNAFLIRGVTQSHCHHSIL